MSLYDEVRDRVGIFDCVRHFGYRPNRSGFMLCPFHHEKTPSMKVYDSGTWICFGCGKRGHGPIDFTMEVCGYSKSFDAVKRLNDDFHLGLSLDKPPDAGAARRRGEIAEARQLFEAWRDDFVRQLNAAFREAHIAMKEIGPHGDKLSRSQVMAIQWAPMFEYWADVLTHGELKSQMEIFAERTVIQSRLYQILNTQSTPTRSEMN